MADTTRYERDPHTGKALERALAVQLAANRSHAPAVNTAAVVTLPAPGAGLCNVIHDLAFGYDAAPTSGLLKIEDGAGTIRLTVPITSAGAAFLRFEPALKGADNTALIVTLAGAGAAVSGSVNVPNPEIWTV